MLAVAAAYQGVWAAAFPLSFYKDFPGPGLHWVAALGPPDGARQGDQTRSFRTLQ